MITGSVMAGRLVAGWMIKGPASGRPFGILKIMLSPELMAVLASSMAWRNEPGPLSAMLLTVNVRPGRVLTASRHGENSDVLPNRSVAVAVRARPGRSTIVGNVTLKGALPLESVVTSRDPR